MIEYLISDPDPIIRYKARVLALGQDPGLAEIREIQEEIRVCGRVRKMLCDRDERGEIPFHPYAKWQGAHWVLTVLADSGYPPGDPALLPLRDQVYTWFFSDEHKESIRVRSKNHRQPRMHGSMEANALFSSLALGLTEARTPELVERLLWAQWEDGGWNCDQHKHANTSSFFESITPLRALSRYARETGDTRARSAAERCAEVFLKRCLFRRISDGEVIRTDFLKPRTPTFWHYDILFGLKVMAEAGFIKDPRCQEALDVLESKRLPGGWFAAEGKHYTVYGVPGKTLHGGIRADWGPSGSKQPNPFITADALYVLREAGRL